MIVNKLLKFVVMFTFLNRPGQAKTSVPCLLLAARG